MREFRPDSGEQASAHTPPCKLRTVSTRVSYGEGRGVQAFVYCADGNSRQVRYSPHSLPMQHQHH